MQCFCERKAILSDLCVRCIDERILLCRRFDVLLCVVQFNCPVVGCDDVVLLCVLVLHYRWSCTAGDASHHWFATILLNSGSCTFRITLTTTTGESAWRDPNCPILACGVSGSSGNYKRWNHMQCACCTHWHRLWASVYMRRSVQSMYMCIVWKCICIVW